MTRGDDPLGKRALFSPAPAGPATPAPTAGGRSGRRAALFSAPTPSPAPHPGASDPMVADPMVTDPMVTGSVPTDSVTAPGSSGLVELECRSCRVVTPLGAASLVRALVPSVWVPLLPWSRVLRCPACGRWTRARISWWPRPAATPGP